MKFLDTISAFSEISFGAVTLSSLLSAALVFLICLLAITVILRIVDRIQKNSPLDKTVSSFIRSAIKVGLWILSLIIVADKLGIKTTSLVTLIGIVGLALSLSIQGVLSNLFSGLTLLTTRPFTAGDFIELDGVSGTVIELGLFYTAMKTADNRLIYVPNSQVAGAKIINCTREKNRRVDMGFCVHYDAPPEAVKAALLETAEADDRVLREPAPFVGLLAYRDGAAEYVLRVWTRQEDYWGFYFAANERVREALEARGISMAPKPLGVRLEQ